MVFKNRSIISLSFLFLIIFSSCNNFFSDRQSANTSSKDEKTPVAFNFYINDNNIDRRIIATNFVPNAYEFNFVCNTNSEKSFISTLVTSPSYEIELLPQENYTLTLRGLHNSILVSQITEPYTFTVESADVLEPAPSIQMKLAGEGTFSAVYSWASSFASVSSVTVSLVDADGVDCSTYVPAPEITSLLDTGAKNLTITSSDLPVGYYVLSLDFKDAASSTILLYKESVIIRAGRIATSDNAVSGEVILGASWFAVPPPEVQDAYYIVDQNYNVTVVWSNESYWPWLTYEVSYTSDGTTDTVTDVSELENNNFASKITGLVGEVTEIKVISSNSKGTTETTVNNHINFTDSVTYGTNITNVANYFEEGTPLVIQPTLTGSISSYPDLITDLGVTIISEESKYTLLLDPGQTGLMTVTTNFSDSAVNLDLYTIKVLPQGQCYVNATGTDPSSGSNTNNFPLIQTAIERINNAHIVSDPYIINVSGTFTVTSTITFNADLLPCNISFIGDGSAIIDGDSTYGVMSIIGDGGSFILDKVTLQNGNAENGGGLNISGTNTITLNNSTIQNNTAQRGGGLALNSGWQGTIDFQDTSVLQFNKTSLNEGSALYVGSAIDTQTINIYGNIVDNIFDDGSPNEDSYVVYIESNENLNTNFNEHTSFTYDQKKYVIYIKSPAQINMNSQSPATKMVFATDDYTAYNVIPLLKNINAVGVEKFISYDESYEINDDGNFVTP